MTLSEHTYHAFGTTVFSSVELPLPPAPGGETGGRTLRVHARPLGDDDSPLVWRDARFDRALHRLGPSSFEMRGTAGGFAIEGDELAVDPAVAGSAMRACASGVGLWLQLRGVPVIHASAVEIDGGVLGFMGPSGRGKSTMAAVLVARGGGHVSDEMLVVDGREGDLVVPPGSARFRLWPEVAASFGDVSALEPVAEGASKLVAPLSHVGDGRIRTSPTPLAALVMLERSRDSAAAPTFERLAPRDAVRVLISQSYMGDAADGMGLQVARFHALAALVRRVPVFALAYPSGLDRLDEVVDAVRRIASRSRRAMVEATP